MSGIRSSFVFCMEDKFKGGKPADRAWICPPAGSFLSTTHNRSTSKIYSAGSKFWDTVAYGQMSGTFEWTFVADYDYIEPFFLIFEDVSYNSSTKTYSFSKANVKRVPSFTIRRKTLNRMFNGLYDASKDNVDDETIIYTGCVVKTARFSKAAGASQLNVTLSGFYANEEMSSDKLNATDYQEYAGDLMEFQCMFIDSISSDNYVANTESLSLAIENSAAAIYSTCTPFASEFSEGQTSFSFGTTCYSNDPSHYKRRVYSGGYDNKTLKPMSKGMKPIPKVLLATYTGNVSADTSSDVASAYASSGKTSVFTLTKMVVKSLTWQKGDGSKLQDQINSTEVQKVKLDIKNGSSLNTSAIWTSANGHALKETKTSTGEN